MHKLRAGVVLVVVVLLSVFLASPPEVQAANFTIANGDVAGLIAAINAANDEVANPGPDTIELTPGAPYIMTAVYDPNAAGTGPTGLPAINTDITINGNGSIIQRDAAAPLFRFITTFDTTAVLTLNSLNLEGGAANGVGGAMVVAGGRATLNFVTLYGNTADDGGGIANLGVTLTVNTSAMVNNTSTNCCGGGLLTGGDTMLNNTYIVANTSPGGGGVFNNGNLIIDQTIFGQNFTSGAGGGLYNNGGTVTITGGFFSYHTNVNNGGAIFNPLGTVDITGTAFHGNETVAGGAGGALYNVGSMTITAGSFTNNVAPFGSGGAVYNNTGGTMTIADSSFSDNDGDGGGIYNLGDLVITQSAFLGNAADSGGTGTGGGAILNSGQLSIMRSRLTNNTTDVSGSAILDTTGTATVTSNCIVGNRTDVISVFNAAGTTLDARGNWWGSANGPSGAGGGSGDSVNANVNFSGFLTSQPAYCGGASASALPPDVPLCIDFDGTANPAVRARLQPGVFGIYCRILAVDGVFTHSPSEIGNLYVLNQGVITAVDVFSPSNADASGTWVCLHGTGSLLFLDAFSAPRSVRTLLSTAEGDYTCTTIPNVGTLVLVASAGTPSLIAPSGSVALSGCRVTTTHAVRLRTGPTATSAIMTVLPYNLTLTATEQQGTWFRVIYLDGQGWVSADYVATKGNCID